MKNLKTKAFLLISLLLAAGQTFAQDVQMIDSVRGTRYCEVLVVKGTGKDLAAYVYNTLGCNACPLDKWQNVDADLLKRKLHAKAIIMNGPRFYVMDAIEQSDSNQPTMNFSGITLKRRATIDFSSGSILTAKSKKYSERKVHRAVKFVFRKGSQVYELVSPYHTYVMQSYTQLVDQDLKESDLPDLAKKLKLPPGWEYKITKLSDDLILKNLEAKETYLIQDNLENTYQRIN